MFIFDPSCRPVKRAGVTPITLRSGEVVHRELVTGSALKEYEYECDYSPPPPLGDSLPRQEARVFQPPFPGFALGPPSYPKEDEKKTEEKKGWFSGWFSGGENRFTKHRRRNKMTRRAKRKTNRTRRKGYRYTKRKHNNNKRSTR
jgi:hypothetical protein